MAAQQAQKVSASIVPLFLFLSPPPSALPPLPPFPSPSPYLHPGVALDHDVLRLHVAMHEAAGVDEGQGPEHLLGDGAEAGEGEEGRLVVEAGVALDVVEVLLQELRDQDQVLL